LAFQSNFEFWRSLRKSGHRRLTRHTSFKEGTAMKTFKTLMLTAVLATLGTSAYADHNWSHNSYSGDVCAPGHSGYGNSYVNPLRYGSSYGYGRAASWNDDYDYSRGKDYGWSGYSNFGNRYDSGWFNNSGWSNVNGYSSKAPHLSYNNSWYDYHTSIPRSHFEPWPGYGRY